MTYDAQHRERSESIFFTESYLACLIPLNQVSSSNMDKANQVKLLKQRHSAIAWWMRTMREHPYGFVPLPTAARMLGVTTNRVRALVDEGRLSVVSGMPGGNDRDRFIPVDDLIDAPFAMARGRPGVFGVKNRTSPEKLKNNQNHRNHLRIKKLLGE